MFIGNRTAGPSLFVRPAEGVRFKTTWRAPIDTAGVRSGLGDLVKNYPECGAVVQ